MLDVVYGCSGGTVCNSCKHRGGGEKQESAVLWMTPLVERNQTLPTNPHSGFDHRAHAHAHPALRTVMVPPIIFQPPPSVGPAASPLLSGMADRASLGVTGAGGTLWVFRHDDGVLLPTDLAHSLRRSKSRWDDPGYLRRIICEDVWARCPGAVEGGALGFVPLDSEWGRPVLVVDIVSRIVNAGPLRRVSDPAVLPNGWSWSNWITSTPSWSMIRNAVNNVVHKSA